MIKLKGDKHNFFKEPTDSVIISIMEGTKGSAWTDDKNKQAFAFDGIYGYLDGEVNAQFVAKSIEIAIKSKTMDNITIVPQNEIAEIVLIQFLESKEKLAYEKKVRYLMSEPAEGFDVSLLKKIVNSLPENMKIESLDEKYFNAIKKCKELEYLAESYKDYDEFKNVGVGFLITENGRIIAGAVSYSVFSEGIEIQLMTVPEYRGKGMAGIIAARLLLYCRENGLRAIWDAANLTSVSIANRMGYVLKCKYNAYTVYEAKQVNYQTGSNDL